MKKLITFILTAIFLTTVFLMPTGCLNGGESVIESQSQSQSQVESQSKEDQDIGKPADERYTFNDGVHIMTAPEVNGEYIVKNGATDYVMVIPANADDRVELAADEFRVLFKRATNIEIPSVRDNSDDPILKDNNARRISIGETVLVPTDADERKAFGYDPSILGTDGVRIITKNNTVYLLGGSFYGVLYAVYDFMQICFNYEFY